MTLIEWSIILGVLCLICALDIINISKLQNDLNNEINTNIRAHYQSLHNLQKYIETKDIIDKYAKKTNMTFQKYCFEADWIEFRDNNSKIKGIYRNELIERYEDLEKCCGKKS